MATRKPAQNTTCGGKNMQNHQIQFPNLDALRFLAFWGVFTAHVSIGYGNLSATNWLIDIVATLFSFPYFGVPFFFTLSSFLISWRILEEVNQTGGFRLWNFYARRSLRIWPLYFFVILTIYWLLPWLLRKAGLPSPTLPDPWAFIFFYANFFIIRHGDQFLFALMIFWSLAVEEQFYLVWGLISKYLRASMVYILAALWILSIVFSCYYLYVLREPVTNLRIHTVYILLYLVPGAALAWSAIRQNRMFRLLAAAPPVLFPAVYILLIAVTGLNGHVWPGLEPVSSAILRGILFALIIYDQAFRNKPVWRVGGSKAINYLGKISYGLYVYHALVLSAFMALLPRLTGTQAATGWKLALPAFMITVILAHISYRYLEKPFIDLKTRI
jgi:peptidoglycan/LPS O-acetylase OafA/YrhL